MSRMTQLAQRTVHSAPYQQNFRVAINGADFTESVESVSINYGADGTSEAQINTYRSLRGYENSTVAIRVGYGDYRELYFVGKIATQIENHWGGANEVVCWGPFRLMAEQLLLEQVDYRGKYIADALYDLGKRAGFRSQQLEVRAGRSFLIEEEAIFPLETSLGDVANTLCQSANFVMADLPYGGRMIMPRPRPGQIGAADVRYNEGHFAPEAFRAETSSRNFYSSVIVFRKSESGSMEINVRRPVSVESREKPPVGRAFVIPEFAGTYAEAEKEATQTARYLGKGVFAVTLSDIPANTEISMYTTLQTTVTELREQANQVERWRVTYKWVADGGVGMNLSRNGNNMTVTGTGIVAHEERITRRDNYVGRNRAVV